MPPLIVYVLSVIIICCHPTIEILGFVQPITPIQRQYSNNNHVLLSTTSDTPTQDASSTTISNSSPEIQTALQYLASTTLALLSGDEDAASSLSGGAAQKKEIVTQVFEAYDVCESGTLSVEEARELFADLSRSMVLELSKGGSATEPARAHARRVLADDEEMNTIDRVARKLLLMADKDRDGKINLQELAQLFETVFEANFGPTHNEKNDDDTTKQKGGSPSGTFPQPLRALAGSLQLLPPRERAIASDAAERSALWNAGVPGDDHTLRRVILLLEDGGESTTNNDAKKKKQNQSNNSLTLIGLGRSADASAYFLPELGIALDAGLHVSSLRPKTVLLTHGHRDRK